MAKKKRFIGSKKEKYTGGMHLEFHERIYKVVTEAVAKESGPKLPEELLPDYGTTVGLLVELNRETRARVESAQQKEADRNRNETIGYLFRRINGSASSPEPTEREASPVLKIAIRDYRKLRKESMDEKTGHIRGLLEDLRNAENAPHIATLGLTKTLETLEAQNKEYDRLRTTRTKVRITNAHEKTKDVRRHADLDYNEICQHIYAIYLRSEVEAERLVAGELIDEINQIITEYKTVYNMKVAQKKKPV